MSWVERIIKAHTDVTYAVSHYSRLRSDRYFVWAEDAVNDLSADDVHSERAIQGSTDLYTKIEFDPWAARFEASLDELGIAWYKSSVQYEEDTGYIHHEWIWEVLDGND